MVSGAEYRPVLPLIAADTTEGSMPCRPSLAWETGLLEQNRGSSNP
jgi:hypothetical protein